jgi:DNA repair exonuclease SbcCD ATPase subunit
MLESVVVKEIAAWERWSNGSLMEPPPAALVLPVRRVIEQLQRGLNSKAMSDDFVIARKVQEECLSRARGVLDSSGAKRDLSVREEELRRLRERAKRLTESVQEQRLNLARVDKPGMVPGSKLEQLQVELDAEKRILEERLHDWTIQLEAGRDRLRQATENVERVRGELLEEQERHTAVMHDWQKDLAEAQHIARNQADELRAYEEQVEPVVATVHKMRSEADNAAVRSQEFRDKLVKVASNYSEEIQRLSAITDPVGDSLGGQSGSASPRPAVPWSPPKRAPPQRFSPSQPNMATGGIPIRQMAVSASADKHVAELALIHAEALKATDMIEQEIEALRKSMDR